MNDINPYIHGKCWYGISKVTKVCGLDARAYLVSRPNSFGNVTMWLCADHMKKMKRAKYTCVLVALLPKDDAPL